MRLLKRVCLLLISIWATIATNAQETFFPVSDGETARYTTEIGINDAAITGILILKRQDGNLAGTLMNEFGIKAFDFTRKKEGKIKLLNVIDMMDKWYIRYTLKRDLRFLLDNADKAEGYKKGKREIRHEENGGITLYNKKRKITYRLRPIQ